MTELVIVLVILAVITAIAVPRFSVAAENARASALLADAYSLQSAVGRYAAEHSGQTPAHNPDGSLIDDPGLFARRLLEHTDGSGQPVDDGLFGPYLRTMPANSVNGLLSVRVGGAAAGDDSAGWHFDPATLEVSADDSPESAAATKSHKKTKAFIEKAKGRRRR